MLNFHYNTLCCWTSPCKECNWNASKPSTVPSLCWHLLDLNGFRDLVFPGPLCITRPLIVEILARIIVLYSYCLLSTQITNTMHAKLAAKFPLDWPHRGSSLLVSQTLHILMAPSYCPIYSVLNLH
jgi:hypothetical protein